MSINGVIQNVKWTDLVLTQSIDGTKVKVDAKNFTLGDNQRWIGQPVYNSSKGISETTIQNKGSGDYLAWDDQYKVIISDVERFWKFVYINGQASFQVPHAQGDSSPSFYTLELDADKSVVLKYQEGALIDAQKWTVVPK
ncbi:hypothetical protein F4604DRAFT_1933842 [Suillus subluteus]|nr:hypothetical protein F4604DRAFT_1933842 [Suillus subluteus]